MSGMRQWLEGLGLGQYAEAFESNEIDLPLLPQVDDQTLKDIGIAVAGHRLRIRSAITALGGATLVQSGAGERSAALQHSPPAAERRQLTVMFCDLVGSTELSRRLDPEALRELMQAYQRVCSAVIDRYQGHVAQYLGDGLMIYFGWPRAHEDDAERAVRASLEIVAAVKQVRAPEPVRVRIGIATGPVVVGETGEGDASIPKLAVGETPNIAARLQALSKPDQIIVSASTRRLVARVFDCRDLGDQTLKGIVEPVHAFCVEGLGTAESRFEAKQGGDLTPFVGREEEVSLLLRRWHSAAEGEGQVVLLCGEPGIGKSRVVRELRDRLAEIQHHSLRCQCSPYYTNSALHPFIALLARSAGFDRDDSVELRLDKLEGMLARLSFEPLAAGPLLAALMSIDASDRYPAIRLSPQRQKEDTVALLSDVVWRLARQRPVLFVFEDVHWVDPTSLEVLDLLVSHIGGHRVLMAVSFRPEFASRWTGQSQVSFLSLSRLARKQAAAMVAKVTGGRDLPEAVLDEIVAKTDGVPLFVEELTKAVLESGLLRMQDDRYVLTAPLTALAIPSTLQDSLMARLDRLSEVREVAQIGACIGRDFPYELLAAVCKLPEGKLRAVLDELTGSELVFRRGVPPEAVYTFKHALVQEAAYDSLLKSRRAQLHALLVDALEMTFPDQVANQPEAIARHATAAGATEKAVSYWLAAAMKAHERFANAEAIGHARKGLEVLQGLPEGQARDRLELLLQTFLGQSMSNANGYGAPEVWQPYARAQELCDRVGDIPQMLPILGGLFFYHAMRADYGPCLQTTEHILELATRLGDDGASVLGHWGVCTNHLFQARLTAAQEHAEAGWAVYGLLDNRTLAPAFNIDPGPCCADWGAWIYWLRGYPDQAEQWSRKAIVAARESGHPFTIVTVLVHSGLYYYFRGDPQMALDRGRAANKVCDEVGFPLRKAEADMCEGWGLVGLGQTAEGVLKLEAGLSLWHQLGTEIGNPLFYAMLALAYQRVGRHRDAGTQLQRALETAERNDERQWQAELHRLDGVFRRDAGEAEDAVETCFRRAVQVARSQGAKILELRASTSLAASLLAQGKRTEARQAVAPVYGWFSEGFDTRDLREAKALLERLA